MTTQKQQKAAKKNIHKAQAAWKSMSSRQHVLSQPEGRKRRKPGTTGGGGYYHVGLRAKEQFATFRTQDVGEPGHIQRVAGKRGSGPWDTVKWLISKGDAHVEGGKLIPDTSGAKKVFEDLGSTPRLVKGDMFAAKPRRNIPEREKPTPAQKKARGANIAKAQAARHGK